MAACLLIYCLIAQGTFSWAALRALGLAINCEGCFVEVV